RVPPPAPRPISTPFPYTTLFRSQLPGGHEDGEVPRDDLPDHPERLVEVVGDGVLVQLGDTTLLGADRAGEVAEVVDRQREVRVEDRKSTRLNSSHVSISYAVFCL